MPIRKNKIIKLLKELVTELNKKINITRAYLFGSYANGRPNEWSDIDLALVSSQFKGIRFFDCKMLIPFIKRWTNFIEIHPFNQKDFNQNNLFVREIIKHGIKIK